MTLIEAGMRSAAGVTTPLGTDGKNTAPGTLAMADVRSARCSVAPGVSLLTAATTAARTASCTLATL